MKCPTCGYNNREDAPYCSMCQGSFTKKMEPAPWMQRPHLNKVIGTDNFERASFADSGNWCASAETPPVLSTAGSVVETFADISKLLDLN